MRLTVCLEGNGEGRVLTSLDMEDIVKMTQTNDVTKCNLTTEALADHDKQIRDEVIDKYLPDQEKRILLSALSHEMKLVKDNNLTELIPVVKNLDYKFMYDRLFKQIENNAYQQGKKDKEEELKEHNVFVSNVAIEDIVLDARKDERERIIKELEEKKHKVYSTYYLSENDIDLGVTFGLENAIKLVRGDVNENEI